MDNQAKQVLESGILGHQSENPYEGMMANVNPEQNQTIDHQAAFEAQYDKNINTSHVPQDDGAYGFEENGTYCRTGNFYNGFIETDLRIVKQKGVEQRSVTISIINKADTAELFEENGILVLKMDMKSEEQFNRFKNFIANLKWND